MDENIRVYDFKKPQRYSSDNMRFLSVVSEEFCKAAWARSSCIRFSPDRGYHSPRA